MRSARLRSGLVSGFCTVHPFHASTPPLQNLQMLLVRHMATPSSNRARIIAPRRQERGWAGGITSPSVRENPHSRFSNNARSFSPILSE